MNPVNASILTIGDELLIGQTIDTNSAFIAQELNKIGIWVQRRLAVGDDYQQIWQALDEEGGKSEVVIITGGLGPTADDITKPLLCRYFGGKLIVNEQVLAHVRYLFEKVYRRPGAMLERNLKQAEVPDVCTVLHNARGTAPGMWFEKQFPSSGQSANNRNVIFISLPGVPHEMRGLIRDEVIPRLKAQLTLPVILHRTAFTSGIGESMLAEKISGFEQSLPAHIKLAYLPGFGMVKLRLTSRGENAEILERELEETFQTLLSQVDNWLVTPSDEGLEIVVGRLLRERGMTLATAESCTGGYIAHLLTSVAGSSAYYKGSVVAYANSVKERTLGVSSQTLATVGAVSRETVSEMARGAISQLQSDFALATSGIMGPDGGSAEKPVGTVWIAVASRDKVKAQEFSFRFDRERNIRQTAHTALDFLRKFILADS